MWGHIRTVVLVALAAIHSASGADTGEGNASGREHLPGLTGGYIIEARPRGELVAIALPSLRETVLRPAISYDVQPNYGSVDVVSGPDHAGRVAYIIGRESDQLLKVINVDGSADATISSRERKSEKDGFGRTLALAPRGNKLALIGSLRHVNVGAPPPGLALYVGNVEICDVASGDIVGTDAIALENYRRANHGHVCWLPDGVRLVYVAMLPSGTWDAAPHASGDAVAASVWRGWTLLPVLHILDTRTGKSRPLRTGWHPVVSHDGSHVICADGHHRLRKVDVETGVSVDMRLVAKVISNPKADLVVAWGVPGSAHYAKFGSPLVPRTRLLAIEVRDLQGQRFETIVPEVDPRHPISFGTVDLRGR